MVNAARTIKEIRENVRRHLELLDPVFFFLGGAGGAGIKVTVHHKAKVQGAVSDYTECDLSSALWKTVNLFQSLLERRGNGDRRRGAIQGTASQETKEKRSLYLISLLCSPREQALYRTPPNWVSDSFYLVLISDEMKFSSSRSMTQLILEGTTTPIDMMTFVTTVAEVKRKQDG